MIDMIRLIARTYRFEPILVAECTVCGYCARYGEKIALHTVIENAQRHVREDHDGQQRGSA